MWLLGRSAITVGVREAKNRLSEYLLKVKAGERVLITSPLYVDEDDTALVKKATEEDGRHISTH